MSGNLIDEKPKEKEWISPPDEAKEVMRQRIMRSIFPIIRGIEEDEDIPVSVRRILTAIEVAKKLETDTDKEFALGNPDNKAHGHYAAVMDIIATCVAAVI